MPELTRLAYKGPNVDDGLEWWDLNFRARVINVLLNRIRFLLFFRLWYSGIYKNIEISPNQQKQQQHYGEN